MFGLKPLHRNFPRKIFNMLEKLSSTSKRKKSFPTEKINFHMKLHEEAFNQLFTFFNEKTRSKNEKAKKTR